MKLSQDVADMKVALVVKTSKEDEAAKKDTAILDLKNELKKCHDDLLKSTDNLSKVNMDLARAQHMLEVADKKMTEKAKKDAKAKSEVMYIAFQHKQMMANQQEQLMLLPEARFAPRTSAAAAFPSGARAIRASLGILFPSRGAPGRLAAAPGHRRAPLAAHGHLEMSCPSLGAGTASPPARRGRRR